MVDRGPRKHGRHRQAVMREYEGICHLCGEPYADAIDHIIPVAHGGSDHPDNLRPAHTACNSSKRDTLPHDWESLPATCWVGEKGRPPTAEEIRQHVARGELERQREKESQKRQREEQRRAEKEAARKEEWRRKKARVDSEVQRLEAERLDARKQIEALDSEPKLRVRFWGYWPWLLPVPVFFIIDNLWSRTAAWWLAILALPFLAFPTFMKVNERVLDEKDQRARRRKDLETNERLAKYRIEREEESLKPRNRRYGYSRRRSYGRGYRRW